MMDTAENPEIFQQLDNDSDDSDYLKRDDGGHGNAWGFSKYMANDNVVNKPEFVEDEELKEEDLTFKERVDNLLKIHNIDMSKESSENAKDDTFKYVKP